MKFIKWALLSILAVATAFGAAWVVTFGWAMPGCHGVC